MGNCFFMVSKKGQGKKVVKKKTAGVKSGSAKKVAVDKLKAEVKKSKKEVLSKKVDSPVFSEESTASMVVTKNSGHIVVNEGARRTDSFDDHSANIGVFKNGVARATGHRKRAIAKVACKTHDGKLSISVNSFDYKKFFTKLIHQETVCAPFVLLGIKTGYVVNAEVFGGGKTGQADALKLGLSRCLALLSDEYAKVLRKNSFLTRDARKVEPKKAGLKKARKREQFSKR